MSKKETKKFENSPFFNVSQLGFTIENRNIRQKEDKQLKTVDYCMNLSLSHRISILFGDKKDISVYSARNAHEFEI